MHAVASHSDNRGASHDYATSPMLDCIKVVRATIVPLKVVHIFKQGTRGTHVSRFIYVVQPTL